MITENAINGLFRPVIGFFVGIALAYILQLANSAGWVFALGWMVFVCLLFGAVLMFHSFLDWGFDKLTGWGLKKPMRAAKAEKAHWFVRFGWIGGVILGVSTVFFLPKEVLAWIL